MIMYYLLQFFISVGNFITGIFGSVTVLPFGTDTPLSTVFSWGAYIQSVFWPIEVVKTVIIIYLTWRITIMVYKTIFGSRAVVN